MGNGVQVGQGLGICKDHAPQGLPVHLPRPIQNGGTEAGRQGFPHRGAVGQQIMIHLIGVNDVGPQSGQYVEGCGLARPGGAGDADAFHVLRLRMLVYHMIQGVCERFVNCGGLLFSIPQMPCDWKTIFSRTE